MNIIRTVSMIDASAVLTGLKRVSDLSVGLYVFGSGVPVGTQIFSIDGTLLTVTLTSPLTLTQLVAVEFTTASRDVYLERLNALKDVQNIMKERGDLIKFVSRQEGDVVRDSYNSIKKREEGQVIFLNAFPIQWQPDKNRLEKAGLKQDCQVLVYTAMGDWLANGIGYDDIDINLRSTVILQGNKYEVIEKGHAGQFNDTFLYVTFSLNKR